MQTTEDKFKALFKKLEKLGDIKLYNDPVAAGLAKMNDKIAQIQNNRSEATVIANRLQKKRAIIANQVKDAKDTLKLKFNILLSSTDERIQIRLKGAKSKDERTAIVDTMLHKEYGKVNKLTKRLNYLEAVITCAENTLSSLRSAKESFGKQLSIVQQQIELQEISPHQYIRNLEDGTDG